MQLTERQLSVLEAVPSGDSVLVDDQLIDTCKELKKLGLIESTRLVAFMDTVKSTLTMRQAYRRTKAGEKVVSKSK